MEFRVGGLLFTSKFDSGNLARVEKVSKDDDEDSGMSDKYYGEPKPDYEFNVWTKPDCGGTEYENGNRSWFYFGIRGWNPNRLIRINIMNMNRQGKLYSQGHAPITKTIPGQPKWNRIRDRPSFETVDGQFILSFNHRFLDVKGAITYFAFCFPWSYLEQQERLNELDKKFAHCKTLTPASPKDSIYFHREVLCYSLDKLRIELLTLSSCHGICSETEPRFDHNLFPEKDQPRCKKFRNKRVYFLSSRVHPGESPASFVFNGYLDFLLRENDPRAKALRKNFVFKFIPMLNPDGVQRGHYRTDQRGVNLNRLYLDPSIDHHPSIYASKSVLVYHHVRNRIVKADDNLNVKINFPGFILNSSPDPISSEKPVQHDAGDYSVNNYNKTSILKPGANPSVNANSVQNANGDLNLVSNRENSWISGNGHDGGLLPPSGRMHVEPLNLGNLERDDTTLSESQRLMGNPGNDLMLSSTCSSVLSTMTFKENRRTVDSELRLRLSELNMSDDGRGKMTGLSMMTSVSMGLNDSDVEDGYTEHLGNEGSEDEGDFTSTFGGGNNAPHLSDPQLLLIPPHESGIAFYVDLHGHASKRGCFIYGNYFENEDTQVTNMLFPKLISMNTAHFDFTGCNFSERNMYTKDKRDGMSKEGSGRVAIHKAIGIIHSYTLECNYNTGRMVNPVPPANGDDGRATPPPVAGFPPKYTIAHFEDVGKALVIAALDYFDINPWSRIGSSEHNSLNGVRDSVRRYIRSMRGGPRIPKNPQKSFIRNNATATNQYNNRLNSNSNSRPPVARVNSTGQDSSAGNNGSASRLRRDSILNQNQKKELGPVREAGRPSLNNTLQQKKRTVPTYPSSQTARTTSGPITLTMTNAEAKKQRQLSADNAARQAEEEKLNNQLKHVNLLAIARKTGPPSRIPLPTGQQFMQLTSPSSPQQELSPPRVPNKSARYNARTPHQAQHYPLKKATAEVLPTEVQLRAYTPGQLAMLNSNLGQGDISMRGEPVTQGHHGIHPPALTPGSGPYSVPAPPQPPEYNGTELLSNESPKRRRRYMYLKRRNINQSPKIGSASNKGQQKSNTSDTNSDAERAKNRRRRRKSLRKINQSPSSDEMGPVEFGPSSSSASHGLEGNSLRLSPRHISSLYHHPDSLLPPRQLSTPIRKQLNSAPDSIAVMNLKWKKRLTQSSHSKRDQATTPSKLSLFWIDY